MKRIITLLIATIMVLVLCACNDGENATVKDNSKVITENMPDDAKNGETEKEPEGIQADGKGEVIPLSDEEKAYVLEQTTEAWLAMDRDTKDALVVLIGRWWEECENIIVEDYDDMVAVLEHQMEQYHKNGIDESVFVTACDIYKADASKYTSDK